MADHLLGGMAAISAALDTDGRVVHLIPLHDLVYGEISGGLSERTRALSALFAGSGFNAKASEEVLQDMWDKWVGFGISAGMTSLMRASFGDIVAVPGGREAILRLVGECSAVATAAGFPPRQQFIESVTSLFTTEGSPIKASMLRDIERGSVTEGEHVLGELTARAHAHGVATPILDLARIHVAAYETMRAREQVAA